MDKKEYKYKVITRCFTYNHAPYITDTLSGFAIQKTNFTAVYIIVDDASSDGEPNILREWVDENLKVDGCSPLWREMPYGQLAVGVLKNNENNMFVVLLLAENHYQNKNEQKKYEYIAEWNENAQYMAICEGDDYWIDPLKLQKQVDYLDGNDDYGLVYTYRKVFYQETGTIVNNANHCHSGNITKELIIDNFIPTLTICYRASLIEQIDTSFKSLPLLMGDYPFVIEISRHTQIHCLTDITAVYRILSESASHSASLKKRLAFKINAYQIKLFFIKKYKYDELYKGIYSDYLYLESLYNMLERRFFKSMKLYCKSTHYSLKDIGRLVYYCFRKG